MVIDRYASTPLEKANWNPSQTRSRNREIPQYSSLSNTRLSSYSHTLSHSLNLALRPLAASNAVMAHCDDEIKDLQSHHFEKQEQIRQAGAFCCYSIHGKRPTRLHQSRKGYNRYYTYRGSSQTHSTPSQGLAVIVQSLPTVVQSSPSLAPRSITSPDAFILC